MLLDHVDFVKKKKERKEIKNRNDSIAAICQV